MYFVLKTVSSGAGDHQKFCSLVGGEAEKRSHIVIYLGRTTCHN